MSAKESQELSDPRFGPEELTNRYFEGSALEIHQEPGRGRFVVASRPIPAGARVMDALPYSFSVEDELKTIACAHCLKPSIETMARVFAGSIASVDAVLFNERMEAGEDPEVLAAELVQRAIEMQVGSTAAEDDTPLNIALDTLERNMADSSSSTLSNPNHSGDIGFHQQWTITCEDCQQVYYCSEECKHADSTMHILQCAALRKLRCMRWASGELTMARTIIHTLAKRQMEQKGASDPQYTVPICGGSEHASSHAIKQHASFAFDFDVLGLVSNEDDIAAKTFSNRRPLVNFIRRLGEKFPELALSDTTDIVRLIGKIDQNTFGVRFDRNLSYAFGLYPNMSYFNHTCAPNVCVIQYNTVLNIMALRDIQEGEEVAISYIETNRPTKDRRKCLQVEYNFFCRCPRCNRRATSEASDEFIQRYVCKNRSCDGKGLLIPINDHPSGLKAACNICQSTYIIKRG